MYCGNCGAKNDDTSAFCQGVRRTIDAGGAPAQWSGDSCGAAGAFSGQKESNCSDSGVVVVLLAVWLLFGGRGYKDTVEDFFDACLDGDVQGIIELIPPDLIDNAMEQEGFSMGELASELGNELAGGTVIRRGTAARPRSGR